MKAFWKDKKYWGNVGWLSVLAIMAFGCVGVLIMLATIICVITGEIELNWQMLGHPILTIGILWGAYRMTYRKGV